MLTKFPEVHPRVRPDTCLRCHAIFQVGDRVTQIWIVAGIGEHPNTYRKVPYLGDIPEFGHIACKDKSLNIATEGLITVPRQSLKQTNLDPLRPRVPEYQCAICKKSVVREDRVVPVVAVIGIGIDPETNLPAAMCSDEYEVVHFDCKDPSLKLGGTIVL